MFTPVGDLLKILPRSSKIPEAILALHIRQAFDETLKTVCADLPDETLAKVRAAVFKNGVLTVVCPQMVSAELSMRSGGLVRDINRVLGRRAVTRLRFRTS